MNARAVVPADACFWAILPRTTRRWTRERVASGLEAWVPVPPDLLELAWTELADGRLLVAALAPERLDQAIANAPTAWCLGPEQAPACVDVPQDAVLGLNFLTGRRLPAGQRRWQQRLVWTAAAAALVVTGLVLVGSVRRHRHATAAQTAIIATGDQALAATIPAGLGGHDPDALVRLDQAQRLADSLQQAADGQQGATAALLSAVLAAWPTEVRIQVASLSVDASRCTISGQAPDVAVAQRLAAALATAIATFPGWRMLPLQASAQDGSAQFTCIAVRDGA